MDKGLYTFNVSKYTAWYNSIIAAARGRNNDAYVEKHHIIPRCLKGGDSASNVVELTYREHYLCHWLLTKMVDSYGDRRKLLYAFAYMATGSFRQKHLSSWRVERAKRARKNIPMSEAQKEKLRAHVKTEEHCAKLSEATKKRMSKPGVREHLSKLKTGKKLSEEHRLALKKGHAIPKTEAWKESFSKSRSKEWIFTPYKGEEYIVTSLKKKAQELEVSYTLLHKLYLTKTGRETLNIKSIVQK